MRYGFVGLGNLGGHLAANLVAKGFTVMVCDQDEARAVRHRELGASWAKAPRDLASPCDAVITCLPSPQVSEAVLGELLRAGFRGTWIEMSTLGRDEIVRLVGVAAEKGVR